MAITLFFTQYSSDYKTSEKTTRTFAEGVTLSVDTRSVRVMSDVWDSETYAIYWDEDSQSVKSIGLYYHNESDAWYSQSHAEVDATPEVWAKVREYYASVSYRDLEEKALQDARKIVKGSIVKVVSGRNSKGVEGKVVAVIERYYGMGYRSSLENKVAIATSDVMIDKVVGNKTYQNHRDVVWVWARNCELVEVPEIDTKAIRQIAAERGDEITKALRRA